MYQVKADPLYFKITSISSDEFTSSGYDDVTVYSFTRIKLGDSPMKIHQE